MSRRQQQPGRLHKDEEETVILATQLAQPTLSSRNVEAMMTSMLLGEDSIQHQLFSSILEYKEALLKALHTQLFGVVDEIKTGSQDNVVSLRVINNGRSPIKLVIFAYFV